MASSDDDFDDIQDRLFAQEEQMAELTKLLLANKEGNESDVIKPNRSNKSKRKKSKNSINMRTASTLSWVFPGMGHYYSKRVGKGLMFSALELASIGAFGSLSNDAANIDQDYQIAKENMDTVTGGDYTSVADMNQDGTMNTEDYTYWKSEASRLLDEKNGKQIGMIVSGTAAVGIWIWNARDVKKSRSTYSHEDRFSVGINSHGQVEARIKF